MNDSHDLIGCLDDDDLAEFLATQPEETRDLIKQMLGEEEAARLDAAMQPREEAIAAAGLFRPPKVDPSLPQIVLLHGITDCHLANATGRRNRIWLDYLELIKGRYTSYLTLQPDGRSDQPNVRIEIDGPVSKKYNGALRAWAQSGFKTHVYCYDWRKSALVGADGLHAFLHGLDVVQAGKKVVLVCHSMGGLVAASYAARHSDWQDVVEHCIFVGSPLGGSYSSAVAILGKSPSFHKMDRLSFFETLEDFQNMAASFPGLLDMLPNPELFPEAEDLYSVQGWPGDVQPRQEWLDHSREVKNVLWTSPIFSKATHLVSQDHKTVAELPWNANHDDRNPDVISPEGDGAVLTRSSLAPGLASFKISGEHGTLVIEPKVIAAVEAIAKGQAPELPSISVADLKGTKLAAAAPAAAMAAPASFTAPEPAMAVATALGARFASDGTRGAMLQLRAVTHGQSFSREALAAESFSWQNALSLAIASQFAYQTSSSVLRNEATEQWGMKGCVPFNISATQGFVAWDDAVVVLSFRGTEKNLADWMGNLNVFGRKTDSFGTLHAGFYDGYQVAASRIEEILGTAGASDKKVWLTGHSLGGALAIVAGTALHGRYPLAGMYTYGQPKVGGRELADFYQANYADQYRRFVNDEDVVPMIPPGYRHCGDLMWFNSRGELKPRASAALAAPGAPVPQAGPKEYSEEEFEKLQEQLRAMSQPPAPGALRMPASDEQIQASQALFGISVSDHSIRDGYIPAVAKQL